MKQNTPQIKIAMMRALVSLAQTLNLSETAQDLNATRQTIRRHINELEGIFGVPLFEVVDRTYRLTEAGSARYGQALRILRIVDDLPNTQLDSAGLEKSRFVDCDGREFFSQQHAISTISMKAIPLLRQAFSAWGQSNAQVQHPAWEPFQKYAVLYRKTAHGWVFSNVGASSAYARWFGSTWASSANGNLITEDNLGDDYNSFTMGPYDKIYDEGGVRLDHLYVHLPNENGEMIPGTFQRLLLGTIFPDGSSGLSLLVGITKNVDISMLTSDHENRVREAYMMDTETVED